MHVLAEVSNIKDEMQSFRLLRYVIGFNSNMKRHAWNYDLSKKPDKDILTNRHIRFECDAQ